MTFTTRLLLIGLDSFAGVTLPLLLSGCATAARGTGAPATNTSNAAADHSQVAAQADPSYGISAAMSGDVNGDGLPIWSPNGARIAFRSHHGGNWGEPTSPLARPVNSRSIQTGAF